MKLNLQKISSVTSIIPKFVNVKTSSRVISFLGAQQQNTGGNESHQQQSRSNNFYQDKTFFPAVGVGLAVSTYLGYSYAIYRENQRKEHATKLLTAATQPAVVNKVQSTAHLENLLAEHLSGFIFDPRRVDKAIELIEQGVDVNLMHTSANGDNGTALHAIFSGLYRHQERGHDLFPYFDNTRRLLVAVTNAGVDVNKPCPGWAAFAHPLCFAIGLELPFAAELLLQAGANPYSYTNVQGNSTNAMQLANDLYTRKNANTKPLGEILKLLKQSAVEKPRITYLYGELRLLQQEIDAFQNYSLPASNTFVLSDDAKISIGSAIFLMGLMLVAEGKKSFMNPIQLGGRALIVGCIVNLIAVLTREIKSAKNQLARISESVVEVLVAGKNTLEEMGSATKTVKDVIKECGSTHTKIMVELKDEIKNTIVRLTGNADKVAEAISAGIATGQFKPEAHANITADVKILAPVNVNAKAGINIG